MANRESVHLPVDEFLKLWSCCAHHHGNYSDGPRFISQILMWHLMRCAKQGTRLATTPAIARAAGFLIMGSGLS
jgi:hypothetical protein